MQVKCNKEICQGHGRCAAMAPEVFQLDSNGYLDTEVIDVPEGLEDQAKLGVASCPEEALSLIE